MTATNHLTLTTATERLVTLPGFRWMPGILDTDGCRVVSVKEDGALWVCIARGDEELEWEYAANMALPDLTDPATVGCIERMVQDAWNDPTVFAKAVPSGWMIAHDCGVLQTTVAGRRFPLFPTKIECLTHALEVAAK